MKSNLLIIIYGLIVTMSVMYATQPLQPLLASKFNISIIEASQFTAVILFFLAVAPIIYGYILEKVNAKKMLINASIVLLITNILLGLSQNYELFLFFRVCEALVIPAILTSLMSILANIDSENIKFNMSIYVAGTVFGGLVGRIFSGFIATTFSYEYVFYSLSVAILISFFCLLYNRVFQLCSRLREVPPVSKLNRPLCISTGIVVVLIRYGKNGLRIIP